MFRGDGRTALLNGIANLSAASMLELGYNVVLLAHSQEQADKMAEKIPEDQRDRFYAAYCMVEDAESLNQQLELITSRFGGLDVVVNGVGEMECVDIAHRSGEDFKRVMEGHVLGVYSVMKHCLPLLKKSGAGRVINFTAIEAMCGKFHNGIATAVGKGAIIPLTNAFALENAVYGITANCIAIGAMQTLRKLETEYCALLEKQIPVGRVASAEDIVPVVCFLASREAGYITGAVINASGGAYLG